MIIRVINQDLSTKNNLDIIGTCDTVEEAKEISAENYCWNTVAEQLIDGKWKTLLVNGMTDAERAEFKKIVDRAEKALGAFQNVMTK